MRKPPSFFDYIYNTHNGQDDADPALLQWAAENQDIITDYEKSGILVSPGGIQNARNRELIKSTFFIAQTNINEDGSYGDTWLTPNYAAIAKLDPKLQDLSWRFKRLKIQFEQHRTTRILMQFKNQQELQSYMNDLDTVLAYFIGQDGIDNKFLRQTETGLILETKESEDDDGEPPTLSHAYKKAMIYHSLASHDADEPVSFGVATRNLLPYLCRLIELHYFYDEKTENTTTFAFPMIDVGNMRFRQNGDGTSRYQRLIRSNKRDLVKVDELLTGKILQNEICEQLTGAMREIGVLPEGFRSKFFGLIQNIRENIKDKNGFNPDALTTAQQALIPKMK
ncbi:MAG: hypothetical protein MRY79_07450 [Alphaproteobacteria bacterium]|nr:hypothetical protein [Alphaproteobacteria bacterium]